MEQELGKVVKFFARPGVAAVKIASGSLKVGDQVHFKGHTTDFLQIIESMQVGNAPVLEAGAGADVGIRTQERVRENDAMYKVVPDA